MALTGGNGIGKIPSNILNHEEGALISPKAKIGYFAQNGYKHNSNQNVMGFYAEGLCTTIYRMFSAIFMGVFKTERYWKKSLSVLSGGEISKIVKLAKMPMGRYNVLSMDETQ